MLRRRSTAATDDAGTHLSKGQRVFPEVLSICRIHNTPTNLFGPARIRLYPEFSSGYRLAHLLQDARELSRATGAIHTDHIHPYFMEGPRYFCRIIAKHGTI